MNRHDVKLYLIESYPDEEIVLLDGFDEAFIGIGYQFNKAVACYDKNKILSQLMKWGMSEDEAIEYFEYNIAGSYVGEKTPVIIDMVN